MKILVTGGNGQLGSEIKDLSGSYPNSEFLFTSRAEMPLDNLDAIDNALQSFQPDVVINAGAYTTVDKAESEPELADKVNHLAVAQIAKWVKANNSKLIHVSTDYVFQGDSNVPLKEGEPTNPINIYGATKQKGEQAIVDSEAEAIIIRTAWVYSTYGANFVKTMIRLMTERDEISVISDQIGSPTYARDLAKAILQIVHGAKWTNGIYHFSNEGEISWYDFAIAIRDLSSLDCKINAIPTEQYPTPAKRPKFSLLDKTKIKETFDVEIPFWKNSLTSMLNHL
ncbi:dTDP-4-dehydrorhamnose reductase [Sphingobacterium corticis]|uniref:dTDP-4-dehydrorhamnose reductase n=1 Tax=Sphingobacterium corticis TaxID=1812823 RepID=A0ABW5NIR2_9SPHI